AESLEAKRRRRSDERDPSHKSKVGFQEDGGHAQDPLGCQRDLHAEGPQGDDSRSRVPTLGSNRGARGFARGTRHGPQGSTPRKNRRVSDGRKEKADKDSGEKIGAGASEG